MTSSLKHSIIVAAVVAFSLGSVSLAYAQTNPVPASGPAATPGKNALRAQNRQLAAKVRKELASTKHLNSSGIVILARSGKITLQGNAPDNEQIQLAASTAANVAGVTDVTNYLHVREAGH
ncbi:BON domain-containing protein [Burkholderia cepacia]|uniref:BON domain-containing protein n=1 Tax=Burkholderia cepacia TaxID=292 RepID=UPI001CF32CA1|nr:BON domain-containing protein [Burkholderia cepacia]MCA8348500.1 BON domain-containing protein [Burkholderia cepacia]